MLVIAAASVIIFHHTLRDTTMTRQRTRDVANFPGAGLHAIIAWLLALGRGQRQPQVAGGPGTAALVSSLMFHEWL